ncbi:putative coiled-coil domain-containing protein [Apostichopus japonicus]|uniref:Cilia- and flagella-associated protein 45 n=1 Tax=Stichopus japonicus TaxID=307972 RepID=A0A2G8L2Y4_STIJA|nr:putative coiled-coil domain-containing protein [Apostichopus japonicus]
MPKSVASLESASSSGSRRARTRQYRMVSKTSSVDESLFGSKKTKAKGDARTQNGGFEDMFSNKSGRSSGQRSSKQKEEVQVITKDLIRKLTVPRIDPSGQTLILDRAQFLRIMDASKVLTQEERLAEQQRRAKEKEMASEASNDRKMEMQEFDRTRQKNEELNELELEAQQQSEYLLQKANEQQDEQEDEVKKINELMLNAKCHAIRDAQILEKVEIGQEYTEEEKRLDAMMEVERQKSLQLQEQLENERKHERYEGAAMILQQIAERREERLLDQQRKDQETSEMLSYLEKLQMEDLKDLERKRLIQLEAQKDIAVANLESEEQKKRREEQNQLADLKVVEYQKQKAAREAAFEAEQERLKLEKEKEIARLRAMQERAKDYQAEKDAKRAKRNQEEREREWRRKELEDSIKKAETEKMLKEAREVQVRNKEHFLGVQAQRERAEFERVLNAQVTAMKKEQTQDEVAHNERLDHAESVRRQIREKEQLRIADRTAFFEEGVRINEEARARRAKLDDIKRKKLTELRDNGVPEKYCKEVERRINAPPVPPVS